MWNSHQLLSILVVDLARIRVVVSGSWSSRNGLHGSALLYCGKPAAFLDCGISLQRYTKKLDLSFVFGSRENTNEFFSMVAKVEEVDW